MKKIVCNFVLLPFLFVFFSLPVLFAQVGAIGSHDPGALIKDGDKYYMFTTGEGIYAAYSTDLFAWRSAPKSVFPRGTWPEWINEAVPGFEGHFWAPEAFYMNGQYYIYYSTSTFGSSRSAIGVATSPTLDQDSPDFNWTDQGMVVSSAARTDVNAIDPAIFRDDDGRIYMSYGSFSGGIGLLELDSVSGKRKEGANIQVIAGVEGGRDWEAPYIFKEDGYYYLIVNRGFCCRGLESTYRMVMGRSENIEGPYVDKNGVSLRNGGGTLILGSEGRYIGPGHFGLLRENGINFVTMHYYDRDDNGRPKLDIARMGFDEDGWPYISRNWLAEDTYKVVSEHSSLVWNSAGCTGEAGEPILQQEYETLDCQQWAIEPIGNGIYTIKSADGGKALGLAPGATPGSCNTEWGAELQLVEPEDADCQKFRVGRTVNGAYVFTNLANGLVVDVLDGSLEAGAKLIFWSYTGSPWQRWLLEPALVKVTNLFPENEALLGPDEDIILEWEGEADSYQVYLGNAAGELVLEAGDISENTYTIAADKPVGDYFWRVDAVKGDEVATGEIWSFSIEGPTAVPGFGGEKARKGSLAAYPNPVKGKVNIEFSNPAGGRYSIMVYDSSGKLLRTLQEGTVVPQVVNKMDFHTGEYSPGLYRLQMTTGNEIITLKLLIY